jgi:two-component system phosphate regulon sensor histidine kinase PhoR
MRGEIGKLSKEQTALLSASHRKLDELIHIIAELTELMDIEEKGIPLHKEKTDINEMCQTIMQNYKQQAKLKQIKLAKTAPISPIPLTHIDSQEIHIVMDHFINNAIAYTPEKGKVTINIQVKKEKIRVEVIDTGIGIPKEEQNKIFSKFFRASNAMKTVTDSSGVGLAISKYYISEHKGTTGFISKLNKGSTFWFEIPIQDSENNNA